jgi:flagellar motor switch protein FliM
MLTQAEIDALLNGAIEIEGTETQEGVNLAELMGKSTAGAKESSSDKSVRPYNFWSPNRFSKEQMRALELVHEELAERLTNSLPSFLHTNLRPQVVHTEQGRFHDFLADLQPNSLFHLISLAPLPGQFVITFSPEISFIILEQRLGGSSKSLSKDHSLTEIDQSLLQDLVENMLNDVKAAWGKVVSIEPKLVDSTVNHHWVQMLIGNERVMMITFELIIHETTGTMSFYLPYSMLKPVANELNPHLIIAGRKEQQSDPLARKLNLESVSNTTLPLRVLLGTSSILVRDLMKLEPGQIIQLDQHVADEVVIQVAKKTRFMGRVGKQGVHMAVQITSSLRDNSGSSEKARGI